MNRIQLVLNELGIKQIQLADALGVPRSSVSQWCSNKIQPTLITLNRIADAIGVDVVDLIVSKKKM